MRAARTLDRRVALPGLTPSRHAAHIVVVVDPPGDPAALGQALKTLKRRLGDVGQKSTLDRLKVPSRSGRDSLRVDTTAEMIASAPCKPGLLRAGPMS